MRVPGRIVTFRQGEAPTAWLMFAYSFLAMSSYNIIKPITRSKFITELGADNLPYVQLLAGAGIGLVMYAYDRAVLQLPRRRVIPATQLALALVLIGFWPLFAWDAVWVSAAFYVFGLMFGLLLISQFWTLANDLYDSRQARRLFGFIGGGASLGGAAGAGLTSLAVEAVGTRNLLLISAATLFACTAIVVVIARRQTGRADDRPPKDAPVRSRAPAARPAIAPTGAPATGDRSGVVRMLAGSRHLRVITLLIACAAVGAVVVEQQLNMAVEERGYSLDAVTRILGEITVYLSLAGFVVQLGVTSRLRGSAGLMFSLLLLPVSLVATAAAILATGALWAPAAARVLDTSMRYTVDKTTREVLFLPLSADLKFRAKLFVDVTMDRIARAAGAVGVLVLIKPWGLGLSWPQLSYVSLAITGLWIALSLVARREYLRGFRASLGAHAIEPAAVRFVASDRAAIESLVDELESADEPSVIYAIEMLETLGYGHLVPPALLRHGSPDIRARALGALESTPPDQAVSWRSDVQRLLNDPDPGVRAAAVRASVSLRTPEGAAVIRHFLNDAASRVSVTAAVELADSADPSDVRAAEAALSALVADSSAGGTSGRRDAASALARIRNPAFRSLLVPLIHDDDVDVAREAIDSARTLGAGEPLFVPALVSRLGHRALKGPARATLVGYGPDVVPILAFVMRDANEQPWVRRHVPATLARIPTQPSMDALVAALDDADGFLRYKAVVAIEALRRGHAGLRFDVARVEAHVIGETSRYFSHLTLRHNLVTLDRRHADTLLCRALDDKLTRTLDRIFRLLGLLYAWTDIAAARYSIEQGDARSRAGALEYLDHLLTRDVRRRVLVILESAPAADKVREANRILKTRPRDVADTLAQLVHDDDPVVAAAAVAFVVDLGHVGAFRADLEFVRAHRAVDSIAHDAAVWALAVGVDRDAAARRADRALAVVPAVRPPAVPVMPVVTMARQLGAMPLFAYVSVDELFRIAGAGRLVVRSAGDPLYDRGAPADEVLFLLQGTARAEGADIARATIAAPAALNFAEAIEARPLGRSYAAADPVVGLALPASAFLTMLADNMSMAQGLFRMLLASPRGLEWAAPDASAGPAAPDRATEPVEIALALRRTPVFGRATVEQLKDLVLATMEVSLSAGEVLWDDHRAPAVYHLLSGHAEIEPSAGTPLRVGPGTTLGVAETLTGTAFGGRAIARSAGRALKLDQDELFEVLAEHDDLLREVFAGVLVAGSDPATDPASKADATE